MVKLKKLNFFTFEDYLSLGHDGYTAKAIYEVNSKVTNNEIIFSLKYTETDKPFLKTYPENKDTISEYNKIISDGLSIGAFDGVKLAGVLIVEKRNWNNSLSIEFIEVAEASRGKGIGSKMLNELFRKVKGSGYRIIELETQNTNMPAINFYRKNGFKITGINLVLYDMPEGKDEIAVYLSRII